MYNDVIDLKAFYSSNLGQLARRLITKKIRMVWPDVRGMNIMGLGYAVPYLRPFWEKQIVCLLLCRRSKALQHGQRNILI